MTPNSYTEEEFKKVLKNLFAEKKKVKDLEKQLEEKGLQKRFQAKLADIHKFSLAEEYAKLKASYLEKENECLQAKAQVEKVRPVLKKLVLDLKSAAGEIETLKSQPQRELEELKKTLLNLEQERVHLVERNRELDGELSKKILEEERAHESIHRLKEDSEKVAKESAQKIVEAEYQLLALRDEKEFLLAKNRELEVHLAQEKGQLAEECQLRQALEAEVEKLNRQLEAVQLELGQSDFVALRKEYEVKVQEALVAFSQKEVSHEQTLERCYVKMREMSQRYSEMVEEREQLFKKIEDHQKFLAKLEKEQSGLQNSLKNAHLQCDEQDAELRKAQQHLAKKMKESTLLEDNIERLKKEISDLQTSLDKQKGENDLLQNKLALQQGHEEKMFELLKERAQAAEQLTKEWQDKYLALQKDWQHAKEQISELQKLRKTYEQMATAFSGLKNIIGHIPPSHDITQNEETEDSGH